MTTRAAATQTRGATRRSDADRVIERFRLLATLRAAWLRKLWSEEAPEQGSITHSEVSLHLEGRDRAEAESRWQRSQESLSQTRARLDELTPSTEEPGRLAELIRVFGLDEAESVVLEGCIALALEPALRRVAAYLQDHSGREYITEELVAKLYRPKDLPLPAESALLRWEIVRARELGPGEPRALTCDPVIAAWLRGIVEVSDPLVGLASIPAPVTPLNSWPFDRVRESLARVLEPGSPATVRVIITGRAGSGRRSLAAAVCASNRLPLVVLDTSRAEESQWNRIYRHAQRHAFLNGSPLCWTGELAVTRPWPSDLPAFPLQFLACEHAEDVAPAAGVIDMRFAMPAPTSDERRKLWQTALPATREWEPSQFDALVSRYRVVPGEIRAVAAMRPADPRNARKALRSTTRARLGDIAQLLPATFRWTDLVLPQPLTEALRDLVYEASTRSVFWERKEVRRLFPLGRGLLGLFSGPPGTGKTMAAQVIAAALGYDLVRADLAGLISKFVGESSKNVRRLFTLTRHWPCVVLCDEADAMFARRSQQVNDAMDRFANADAAYLLQAVEEFPGIVLLTTNQKGSIDPAFLRRIRYDLEFPKPNAADRLKMWTNTIASLAGSAPLDTGAADANYLAGAHDLTGAQIKNAVLSAIFIAKRVGIPLSTGSLLRGVERELAKEGRTLSGRDRERILRDG